MLEAAEDMLLRIDHLVAYASGVRNGEDGTREQDLGSHGLGLEGLAALATLQEALSSRTAGRSTAQSGKILLVDDNASNRDVLARRLRREGHEVQLAVDGRSALAAIADAPFDLVLLDLMMPDITGYEVLVRLKAAEATRHIPVIMMSALDALDSVVRCVEAGALDCPSPSIRRCCWPGSRLRSKPSSCATGNIR